MISFYLVSILVISPLPRLVRFKRRKTKEWWEARVIDEVSVLEEYPHGDYTKMIQLLEKTDDKSKWIRFFYYVKDHGKLDEKYRGGAQATLIVKQENASKLFDEAKKKGFF